MEKRIYFLTNKKGVIVNNYDITRVSLIKEGILIDPDDYDSIRIYAKLFCNGIIKEIENPSYKVLLSYGDKTDSIKEYYQQMNKEGKHISLKEAYDYISSLESTYKKEF